MNVRVRVGCSGWIYPCWKGLFYPTNLPYQEWFSFYAHHFNSVEINNTFYRFPTINAINKWYTQAPKGFSYSLKANRLITHFRRFQNAESQLQEFYRLGSLLQEKIEIFLFQLPPSFIYNPAYLQDILSSLDKKYLNVLEFRHPSWWNTEVYEALLKHNIIFCSVSAPGLPDEVLSLNDNVYLRFHGLPWYKASYTEKELHSWATRIKQTKAKHIWIYFNNTSHGYAPINALTLKQYFS
ncbi:DUF72 domain-containing protein [Candidatus Paracaedibacter symbiosus]|uniref:DUF72 domain-containing protein n=1 Tax=Candidatus Paracaedibacter symbiosus TaxID=244582 RepID=UPI000509758F|nr:DUF72 domain-containing protein [Candidatus Paracaedibacter symbiosus]